MAKRGLSSIQQKAKANGGTGGRKYDKIKLGCKRQLAGPNPDLAGKQDAESHTCGEDFLISYQGSRSINKPRLCEACWQAKSKPKKKDPLLLALGLIK